MPLIANNTLHMFADGTKLYAQVDTLDFATLLREDICALEEWSKKWQIHFNPAKCNFMHIGRNNMHHTYNIQHNNKTINLEGTDMKKDLCVFTDKISLSISLYRKVWKKAVTYVVQYSDKGFPKFLYDIS